jgi:choline monooxygenase
MTDPRSSTRPPFDAPSPEDASPDPAFQVDPRIEEASTLPGTVFSDPRYLELQKDRVFARSWQLLADVTGLRAPGHVRPVTLLEGCLDEPLLLVRGEDGSLRCLSNVCTHRGAILVEGEGHLRHLRCRYHGRRFGLDGCLLHMPEFEGVTGFPSPEDDLPRLAVERWGPFAFTALDPAQPFSEWMRPVRERMDWMPLEEFRLDPTTSRDYVVEANWAVYCDNYLEEFHIPYVHGASLTGALDYDRYRTERFPHGSLQLGIGTEREGLFHLPAGHPDDGEPVAAFYFWLFPNLMLNFYPWGLSVNVVIPLGPSRTRITFRSWIWREELRSLGAGADIHRVEMEDEEIVESVQRGVSSRLYGRGRFSPRREVGTHHFHRLLSEAMGLSGA